MEQQEEVLTPSYHGELCRHNGDNPDYEIACDECNFYLICFPDWKEMIEMYDFTDKRIDTIKTSPDEALEAFLRSNAAKDDISDMEIGIDLQVMEELAKRQEARGEGINVKAAWNTLTHGKGLEYFLEGKV